MTAAAWLPLANHLWQSTLCALAAAILALALRNNSATARYRIWLAASLKFLLPFSLLVALGGQIQWNGATAAPAFTPAVHQIGQAFAPIATTGVSFMLEQNSRASQIPILPILSIVWLTGCVAVLFKWFGHWLRIRAIVQSATPLPLQTPIHARSSLSLLEPGVFGVFQPVLLLPAGITTHLAPAHLEAILAHELCHVRRRDNLAAVIHMFVEALFWFHPLVWWIGARLIEEREHACDEEVLRLGNQPQIYAESILKVCQFYLESPLACVSGVTGSDLKQRVVRIMTQRISVRLNLRQKLLLASAATVAIALPLTVGLTNGDQPLKQSASLHEVDRFEVASIKPVHSPGDVFYFKFYRGGVLAKGATLAALINFSFEGIPNEDQILNAPKWLYSDKFDVEAKPSVDEIDDRDPALPDAQRNLSLAKTQARLKLLLEDRFQLKTHTQTREVKGYSLVVGKQGAKFLNSRLPDGSPGGVIKAIGPGRLAGPSILMSYLANWIGRSLGAPVANKTGLDGFYNIDLTFTPDNAIVNSPGDAPDSNGPSLFTALQKQLGLRLVPEKQTAVLLVIDHVEQPSAN
jgi:uncharacterized protein (TIGR03435 family)